MTIPSAIAFILRAPPISYVSNIYYLPFTGVVWMCSISLVILCTSVIAITFKLHWAHDGTARYLNLTDYILFAIASSCQMGSEIMSKILSARISMVCRRCEISDTITFLNCKCFVEILFSVCIFHCPHVHFHIVHRKYCCAITIDHKIYSNRCRPAKSSHWDWCS